MIIKITILYTHQAELPAELLTLQLMQYNLQSLSGYIIILQLTLQWSICDKHEVHLFNYNTSYITFLSTNFSS